MVRNNIFLPIYINIWIYIYILTLEAEIVVSEVRINEKWRRIKKYEITFLRLLLLYRVAEWLSDTEITNLERRPTKSDEERFIKQNLAIHGGAGLRAPCQNRTGVKECGAWWNPGAKRSSPLEIYLNTSPGRQLKTVINYFRDASTCDKLIILIQTDC